MPRGKYAVSDGLLGPASEAAGRLQQTNLAIPETSTTLACSMVRATSSRPPTATTNTLRAVECTRTFRTAVGDNYDGD